MAFWTTISKLAMGAISNIPLPKEAVIVSFRLGLLFKALQVGAVALSFVIIWPSRVDSYLPTNMVTEFWSQSGSSDLTASADVPHCSQPETFDYNYSSLHSFQTRGFCRRPIGADDMLKTENSLWFMTMAQETRTFTAAGGACTGAAGDNCTDFGGNFASEDGICTCTFGVNYYIQNPEHARTFHFRHAYKVPIDKSQQWFQEGSSAMETTVESSSVGSDTRTLQKQVLTIIRKPNGEECEVGGASRWDFDVPAPLGGRLGIGGSISDWLACGDFSLDSRSDRTRSYAPGATTNAPHMRTSGAKVILAMSYSNVHNEGDRYSTVCDVTVNVIPAWNSRRFVDSMIMPNPWDDEGSTALRKRYTYGVAFSFELGGSFSFFDANKLLTAIVNAIVVMSVPLMLIRLFSMYCVGLLSKIYRNVLREPFNIFQCFHGLSARMMVHAVGFRALTNQWEEEASHLQSMTLADIKKYMHDAFHKEVKNGTLSEEEIASLAMVVVEGLDKRGGQEVSTNRGDYQVSFDEFVHACSSGEYMDTRSMVSFFDDQRWRHPIEKLFDDATGTINAREAAMLQMGLEQGAQPGGARSGSGEQPAPASQQDVALGGVCAT